MSSTSLGNPLAVAAADKGVTFLTNNWKPVVLTLGTIGVLYFGPKWYRKVRAKNYANNNIGNPNVMAAAIFYNSFTRIGFADSSFLSYVFPEINLWTDEDSLYNIAHQVSSLNEVAKSYNILFGRVLFNDLHSGLDSDEMSNFYTIIRQGSHNQSTQKYLVGDKLYCAIQRISIPEVEQKNDGSWVETGRLYDNYQYRDYVGTIYYNGYLEEENKHYYIISYCTLIGCFDWGIVWQDQVTNLEID